MVLFQQELSFFAFNPANIHTIRYNVFNLIKWGFSYSDLKNMPLDEFYEYIKLYNEEIERKNREVDRLNEPVIQERKKTIGEILPGASKL